MKNGALENNCDLDSIFVFPGEIFLYFLENISVLCGKIFQYFLEKYLHLKCNICLPGWEPYWWCGCEGGEAAWPQSQYCEQLGALRRAGELLGAKLLIYIFV